MSKRLEQTVLWLIVSLLFLLDRVRLFKPQLWSEGELMQWSTATRIVEMELVHDNINEFSVVNICQSIFESNHNRFTAQS